MGRLTTPTPNVQALLIQEARRRRSVCKSGRPAWCCVARRLRPWTSAAVHRFSLSNSMVAREHCVCSIACFTAQWLGFPPDNGERRDLSSQPWDWSLAFLLNEGFNAIGAGFRTTPPDPALLKLGGQDPLGGSRPDVGWVVESWGRPSWQLQTRLLLYSDCLLTVCIFTLQKTIAIRSLTSYFVLACSRGCFRVENP